MQLEKAIETSLKDYQSFNGKPWTLGDTYQVSNAESFSNYFSQHLLPKVAETEIIQHTGSNRFSNLYKDVDDIAQFSEEAVILDTVPVAMDIDQDAEFLLKENYPAMATRFYGNGTIKKSKFTLNLFSNRFNHKTFADLISYGLGVTKRFKANLDIVEEKEDKATLVDYATNHTKEVRTINRDSIVNETIKAILNLQNNTGKYNETSVIMNNEYATYTYATPIENIRILTDDTTKALLLSEVYPKLFNDYGIDITNSITSFEDLGGVYRLKKDYKLKEADVKILNLKGDYKAMTGDTILEGTVFTFEPKFTGTLDTAYEEIKPDSDLFIFIYDKDAVRFRRYTSRQVDSDKFYNPETGGHTNYLFLHTSKAVSPFYNKILLKGE